MGEIINIKKKGPFNCVGENVLILGYLGLPQYFSHPLLTYLHISNHTHKLENETLTNEIPLITKQVH
jgi:hypothetical protein